MNFREVDIDSEIKFSFEIVEDNKDNKLSAVTTNCFLFKIVR